MFPGNFSVDGEVANLLRTCYGKTGVMDLGLYPAGQLMTAASSVRVCPQQSEMLADPHIGNTVQFYNINSQYILSLASYFLLFRIRGT